MKYEYPTSAKDKDGRVMPAVLVDIHRIRTVIDNGILADRMVSMVVIRLTRFQMEQARRFYGVADNAQIDTIDGLKVFEMDAP